MAKIKGVLVIVLLSLFLPQNVYSADSVININGYVKDNTCAVAPESLYQVIDLLNNEVKRLYKVGETSPFIPFHIKLEPCGNSVIAVKFYFSGTPDSSNSSLLALDPIASSAEGVGIQILDQERVPIPINPSSDELRWVPLVAGKSNTVFFYGRLMVSHVPVLAGRIRASTTFTLEYQ